MNFETEYEYDQAIDETNDKEREKGMLAIKDICNNLITPMNYTKDTKSLTEQVYKEFGLDLKRINGVDLLYGDVKVPKILSVIRRVQLTKKAVIKRITEANFKKAMHTKAKVSTRQRDLTARIKEVYN